MLPDGLVLEDPEVFKGRDFSDLLGGLCKSPLSMPDLSEETRPPLPPALDLPPPRPRPRVDIPRKAAPGSLFPPQAVEDESSRRVAHIEAPVPFAAATDIAM